MEAIGVGIDLGTSTSYAVIATKPPGSPFQLKTIVFDGSPALPSVVSLDAGSWAVGELVAPTAACLRQVKRLMGRGRGDNALWQDLVRTGLPHHINDASPSRPVLHMSDSPDDHICPEEASAMVLWRLAQGIRAQVGSAAFRAVITVPAHFTPAQRQATLDAAKIAGIEAEQLVSEPTAALFSCLMERKPKAPSGYYMVADLGGGTFDVSLIQHESSNGSYTVRATDGDSRLGGADFTSAIRTWALEQCAQDEPGGEAGSRLWRLCEDAKHRLQRGEDQVALDLGGVFPGQPSVTLRRAVFEYCVGPLYFSIRSILDRIAKEDKKKFHRLREVIPIGGSSRLLRFREVLDGWSPDGVADEGNVDQAVARGAAVISLLNRLLESGPTTARPAFQDVLPQSLGILTHDDNGPRVTTVMRRNTQLPAVVDREFYIVEGGGESLMIKVFQGESGDPSANTVLGEFRVGVSPDLLPNTPILVSFQADESGTVHVTAKVEGDEEQGAAELHVSGRPGLAEDEIVALREKLECRIGRKRALSAGGEEPAPKRANIGDTDDTSSVDKMTVVVE